MYRSVRKTSPRRQSESCEEAPCVSLWGAMTNIAIVTYDGTRDCHGRRRIDALTAITDAIANFEADCNHAVGSGTGNRSVLCTPVRYLGSTIIVCTLKKHMEVSVPALTSTAQC